MSLRLPGLPYLIRGTKLHRPVPRHMGSPSQKGSPQRGDQEPGEQHSPRETPRKIPGKHHGRQRPEECRRILMQGDSAVLAVSKVLQVGHKGVIHVWVRKGEDEADQKEQGRPRDADAQTAQEGDEKRFQQGQIRGLP